MESQTIVLDCPPGIVRPDMLLSTVLEGTTISTVEASSKVFGSWVFNFQHIDKELWDAQLDTISGRIQKLYENGAIRYGSW